MAKKISFGGFEYDDSDPVSVYYYGSFLKNTGMLMHDCDKKWEFVCRADNINRTEFPAPQTQAKYLENVAKDISKHLEERPDDKHFIIE
jgi:hypothetical protein